MHLFFGVDFVSFSFASFARSAICCGYSVVGKYFNFVYLRFAHNIRNKKKLHIYIFSYGFHSEASACCRMSVVILT